MTRNRTGGRARAAWALAGVVALAGCGKPPAGGPRGGEGAVQAVVAPVKRQTLEEKTTLVGSLAAMEEVDIVSEIEGRITEIGFAEGGKVAKDQVLFHIDDSKLKAILAEAEARFQVAEANRGRADSLRTNGTISAQEYDQTESAYLAARAARNLVQEQLDDAVIKAPFAGLAAERFVSPGQYVSRGQKLTVLVQTDPLKVEFRAPERYAGQLAPGQRVEIQTAAYPGAAFTGEVRFVSPRLDEATRTLLVKAQVANGDGRLKPGMYGSLDLIFRARQDALVIPEAAVSLRGDRAAVLVVNAEGRAEARPVKTGYRLADAVEIVEGLAEGETVVVEGGMKIRPGGKVAISPKSARYGITPPAPAAPPAGAAPAAGAAEKKKD